MKNIYFKSAHILSLRYKKGFSFNFSPNINIIIGENDTGKSSFIKSLYYTLGADIRLDKKWKEDDFVSKVVICVGDRDYVFIRHDKRISIFDITEGEKFLLISSNSRKEIALTVRDIFHFNLELVTKSDLVQGQALPAALFLPYYIDQDNGWGTVLNSFENLAMYKDWQNNILNFHAGIKPKEYYALKGEINLIDKNLVDVRTTLKALESAKERFDESFGRVLFDVDMKYYEELLDRFLQKCNDLHKEETEYRIKLIEALSLRDDLAIEIEESKKQLSNNDIDSLSPSASLESKYAILEHREKLSQIIPKLYEQKSLYDNEIEKIKADLTGAKKLSLELKGMLQEVRGQLSLQEVINSQASKQVEVTFDEQLDKLQDKIRELDLDKANHLKEIEKFENRKRTKEINDRFKESLKFAQTELGIKDPVVGTILQYSSISKSETGSRAPRAILAYHYALLKTIEDKSTSPMLPVVIDSPKQQDPDPITTKKLFDLCIDGLSTNSQLIIGSVSLEREVEQFKKLTMTEKYGLLKSSCYDEVYKDIMPLYERAALS